MGHIHFLRQQRPDVYAAAAVFLEPVDYLNLRLTGLARASHDSITLHWVTDNRDINAIAYDDSLMALAGLERAKLPDLVPTGSVLGGLTPAAAGELGLLPGTPVVAGTGDLHSAAVGSGAVNDFDGHLYIGTSSWISCHVPFKKTDPLTNIASIPSGIPGRYLVADEHETGGACLTWLRDNLLFPDDALTAPAADPTAPADVFATLNDVAASVPVGSHGVLFTPWLNGERSPVDDHTIRGGFHNISLSSTRADMVRAVFEGVALNSAWLLGAVEKYTKRPFDTLAFVGGGANSDLWSQIHADATGRTIRQIADPVLANVRGAGLLTLLALGHLQIADIPSTVTVKATYEPDPAAGGGLRRPAQGVRQPLREDEGDPQAAERPPAAPGLTARPASGRRERQRVPALGHLPGERVHPVTRRHLVRPDVAHQLHRRHRRRRRGPLDPLARHQDDVDGVAEQRHGLPVGEHVEVGIEGVALGEAAHHPLGHDRLVLRRGSGPRPQTTRPRWPSRPGRTSARTSASSARSAPRSGSLRPRPAPTPAWPTRRASAGRGARPDGSATSPPWRSPPRPPSPP